MVSLARGLGGDTSERASPIIQIPGCRVSTARRHSGDPVAFPSKAVDWHGLEKSGLAIPLTTRAVKWAKYFAGGMDDDCVVGIATRV